MKHWVVRFFIALGALFVLACLGQAVPVQFAFFLLFGWVFYLYRILPQVRLDGWAAITAVACLVLLTTGLHQFASWLYPPLCGSVNGELTCNARSWHARWTAWLIGAVLLMFVAGLACVGVTHQVGWLLSTPEKLVFGSGDAARRAQSTNNLKQIGLALNNYHQEHKSFPPGGTFDPRAANARLASGDLAVSGRTGPLQPA